MDKIKKLEKNVDKERMFVYYNYKNNSSRKEVIIMNKKIYLKNPERLIMSIAILVFIIFGMFGFQNVALGDSIPEYITITVSKGDTIWTIAKDYYQQNDVRDIVEEIKKINNLENSNIKVGQELLLVKAN